MSAQAIIFIPGIKGTKLVETNQTPFDVIWSGIQSNFESIEDLELTTINPEGMFDKNIQNIIKPGEIEQLAYKEFIRDVETDLPKYIFNYDWRFSAQTNGERLNEFLNYLTKKSSSTPGVQKFKKFHFITHSLGNFILRYYLKKYGTSNVDKIIFTVPPFKGSLDILSAALIGEGFFPNVKSKIRKILRTIPGALELLPTYEDNARFIPGGKVYFFNFNHWQGNVKDTSKECNEKMKKVLLFAKNTVEKELLDLSDLSDSERKNILVLVRGGFDTFQAVPVLKNGPDNLANYVDWEGAVKNDQGDGRVPHSSSCCYYNSVTTIMLEDAFWYRDYSHGFVLKDERVQKIVSRFLNMGNHFSYKIPGGSIKRVEGLRKIQEGKLSYLKAITE